MTQDKVHHPLAILYLIFEVNITEVSYVVQCIIVNKQAGAVLCQAQVKLEVIVDVVQEAWR